MPPYSEWANITLQTIRRERRNKRPNFRRINFRELSYTCLIFLTSRCCTKMKTIKDSLRNPKLQNKQCSMYCEIKTSSQNEILYSASDSNNSNLFMAAN